MGAGSQRESALGVPRLREKISPGVVHFDALLVPAQQLSRLIEWSGQ